MTHNQLQDAINNQIVTAPPFALGGYTRFLHALSAIVELHKPYGIEDYPNLKSYCRHCEHLQSQIWPCPTIQAIQEQLK